MSKSEEIKTKLEEAGIRYWAGDNISQVLLSCGVSKYSI